ncbi:MAG: hypothetical protein ABI234_09775 [Ktedonobacteraceae bacterium]
MKIYRSKEADFFAGTLLIIVGIVLFIKAPMVVFLAAAIVTVVCKCFQIAFTGTQKQLTRDGKVGVATYLVYPLFVFVVIVGRLLLALFWVILALNAGGVIVIGILWLIVAGISYVGGGIIHWDNNVVYAILMSELLKAVAIAIIASISEFAQKIAMRIYKKLNETIETLSEGTLVLTWFAVLGIAIIAIVFTPTLWWLIDIQPQFGWPFLQFG